MKQGVAEWFRLQLKEKTWKGLVEHSLDGWNIGTPPYGYLADRIPHPVPVKASQGRTKTRLALDPDRAPWWRRSSPGGPWTGSACPPSPPGSTPTRPATRPRQPRVDRPGREHAAAQPQVHRAHGLRPGPHAQRPPPPVPADQWLWSPEPTHPPIMDRATWDAAQHAGAEHGTSRDGTGLSRHPAAARVYPYRGHCRCRDCRRRMSGLAQARGARLYIYYTCPHNPAKPGDAAAYPDHPRTVKAPETRLDQITGLFFAEHVFGPGRAALLAAQLPATDAAAAAARDQRAAALQARLRRIETGQNSCIVELEELPADPADTAAAAMRGRIRARFAELHTEREQIGTQLAALAQTAPQAIDPTLLDQLPTPGDILPGLTAQLKAELFQAFDLQILWNKPGQQATVHAEITEATLQALPGILDPGRDGYDDTAAKPPANPGPWGICSSPL